MSGVDDLVINWHLIEACNYSCQFCFAKWPRLKDRHDICRDHLASRKLLEQLFLFFSRENPHNPLKEQLRWDALRLSLVGGEPTLLGKKIVDIAHSAKEIGFRLALITNGSKPEVISKLARYVDVLTLSLDSLDKKTNLEIGRFSRSSPPSPPLLFRQVQDIVSNARNINPDIQIKINTVVNSANFSEDMSNEITNLQPNRWKVLKVLPNVSTSLAITDDQFKSFIERHQQLRHLIFPEDNADMTESYIMIEPQGRFFQNGNNEQPYIYSDPITDIGVSDAFKQISFSPLAFSKRYKNHDTE